MNLPRKTLIDTNRSSVIDVIYYQSTFTKRWMVVDFKNGSSYLYNDVPFKTFRRLKKANKNGDSVGSLFHYIVKGAGYGYRKIVQNELIDSLKEGERVNG
tara:strand:+ start:1278 stop:1577 length:300 start_codon:yes stop_codon:yes gene_type:complete